MGNVFLLRLLQPFTTYYLFLLIKRGVERVSSKNFWSNSCRSHTKNNSFQSDFIVTTNFGQKHPKTAIVQYIEIIFLILSRKISSKQIEIKKMPPITSTKCQDYQDYAGVVW